MLAMTCVSSLKTQFTGRHKARKELFQANVNNDLCWIPKNTVYMWTQLEKGALQGKC